jgi:hypothetical protein
LRDSDWGNELNKILFLNLVVENTNRGINLHCVSLGKLEIFYKNFNFTGMSNLIHRTRSILTFAISGFVFFLLLLIPFPQMLFANKLEYKCFIVYYHDSNINSEEFRMVLDKSEKLLKTSKLFDNTIKQKLFICNGFWEYTFFAPLSRKAFGVNYMLVQHIFLSKTSISDNLIVRNGIENNKRTLSSVIAHETVHSLLENKIGLLKNMLLPSWKKEGYCDYIACESSYNSQKGLIDFCNEKEPNSSSFKYFKYKLYITYLLEEDSLTLDQVLKNEFIVAYLDEKGREKYCTN